MPTAIRLWLVWLVTLAAPATLGSQEATGRASAAPVRAVATVGFTVDDVERSVAFFSEVLTFEKISDVEVQGDAYEHLQGVFALRMRVVRMRLGSEEIELTEYLAPKGRPIPVDARSNDRWFQHIAIVVSDMERAYRALRRHRVTHISSGPQRLPDWNPNAGGIEAFYFRDPDGHALELISFPPGKGDPRWQGQTQRLFLGIDHTAIGVSDTEASLAFYRDVLGLEVVGESENYGTEQEHLNAVFGARLRITALRAAAGLGIEFLEYLTPRDGRPLPSDTRANDLIHWQTTLVAADARALADRLRAGRHRFVSSGVVETPNRTLGSRRAFLVRDPDGHVMRIVER